MSWSAQYQQFGQWHDMKFKRITVQQKTGGRVTAHGHDEVGEFIFMGIFKEDQTIRFVKQYKAAHAIHYEGTFDKQRELIKGHWGFEPGERDGEFRMLRE